MLTLYEGPSVACTAWHSVRLTAGSLLTYGNESVSLATDRNEGVQYADQHALCVACMQAGQWVCNMQINMLCVLLACRLGSVSFFRILERREQ